MRSLMIPPCDCGSERVEGVGCTDVFRCQDCGALFETDVFEPRAKKAPRRMRRPVDGGDGE